MPSTDETQLEQAFADMAYSRLRDKSNSLLDYLLGFQLLKSEDDAKRAVGVFGYEIDGKIYYTPAFFLNGEIRGLESIYSTDADLFMPLTDDWVSDLINKADVQVGEPTTKSRRERGAREPDYTRLTIVPGGSNVKLGSAEVYNTLAGGLSESKHGHVMSLPEQLRGLPHDVHVKIAASIRANPALYKAVTSVYPYTDLLPLPKQAAQEKVAAAAEKPVLIIGNVTDEGVEQLTDAQREEILSGGVVVLDDRIETNKAQLYKSETTQNLLNPADNAIYDVLMADGSIEPCLIGNTAQRAPRYLVYGLKSKRWCVTCPDSVFAVRQYLQPAFNEWATDAARPNSVRPGQVVAFVNMDGECTVPVAVDSVTAGVDGSKVLTVYPQEGYCTQPYVGFDVERNGRTETVRDIRQVIITPSKTKVPLYYRGKLVISDEHFRAIVLRSDSNDESELTPVVERPQDVPSYRFSEADFGDYNTLWAQIEKVASKLEAWSVGDEQFFRRDGRIVSTLSKQASYDYLINSCGVSLDAADELLSETATGRRTYYVKEAADPRLELPDMQVLAPGGEMSRFHPTGTPEVRVVQRSSPDNRAAYGYESPFGGAVPDGGRSTLERIQSAVQSGDKEVFDATALSSLIKSYVPTDLVDRYIPSITVGMDRLGRILFLIYWHYNDFAERYGEDELSEMLDNLSTVFQQLGDMLLSLKQRTLAGDPEHYGLGLDMNLEVNQ